MAHAPAQPIFAISDDKDVGVSVSTNEDSFGMKAVNCGAGGGKRKDSLRRQAFNKTKFLDGEDKEYKSDRVLVSDSPACTDKIGRNESMATLVEIPDR